MPIRCNTDTLSGAGSRALDMAWLEHTNSLDLESRFLVCPYCVVAISTSSLKIPQKKSASLQIILDTTITNQYTTDMPIQTAKIIGEFDSSVVESPESRQNRNGDDGLKIQELFALRCHYTAPRWLQVRDRPRPLGIGSPFRGLAPSR